MISPAGADELAARALAGLRTRLGGSHIEHARRVAAAVAPLGDDRLVVAALLHDAVEKGRLTLAERAEAVGDDEVVVLVDALTQRDGEAELEYLTRASRTPAALVIKRADLHDKFAPPEGDMSPDALADIAAQTHRRLAIVDDFLAHRAPQPSG